MPIKDGQIVADDNGCEEASTASHAFYIPCNAPAVAYVYNGDRRPYRMCEWCASHNVRNRGGLLLGPWPADEKMVEGVRRFLAGEQVGASTGIAADEPTYGYGNLDINGYWEFWVPEALVQRKREGRVR